MPGRGPESEARRAPGGGGVPDGGPVRVVAGLRAGRWLRVPCAGRGWVPDGGEGAARRTGVGCRMGAGAGGGLGPVPGGG
ncbi:hypothetical protein GCM10010345_39870 [Streptomyces canarius]|uniref:Uncharacterized protein n=1 Tax=Streptomyces canarius TaxID=285453 RepID=A0ABQ3CPW0_9ACTN|nr:hypothetical protein GCM10010345_39870 [Streptomyces canarius]